MKKIEYKAIHKDQCVDVKITSQTDIERNFGKNGNSFECSNGIYLRSVCVPQNDIDARNIYVGGYGGIKEKVSYTANEFELFKECIEEYNKWFSK